MLSWMPAHLLTHLLRKLPGSLVQIRLDLPPLAMALTSATVRLMMLQLHSMPQMVCTVKCMKLLQQLSLAVAVQMLLSN